MTAFVVRESGSEEFFIEQQQPVIDYFQTATGVAKLNFLDKDGIYPIFSKGGNTEGMAFNRFTFGVFMEEIRCG